MALQVPFTGMLGSASPADLASVCICLPHLLDSAGPGEASGADSDDDERSAAVPEDGTEDAPTTPTRGGSTPLLNDPSFLQPVQLVAGAAMSSFSAMSSRQLHGTASGLAAIGFPAGSSFLDAHAQAMSRLAFAELDAHEREAMEQAYARMRRARLKGGAGKQAASGSVQVVSVRSGGAPS